MNNKPNDVTSEHGAKRDLGELDLGLELRTRTETGTEIRTATGPELRPELGPGLRLGPGLGLGQRLAPGLGPGLGLDPGLGLKLRSKKSLLGRCVNNLDLNFCS